MDADTTKLLSTLSVAIVDDHEMVLEGFSSFMLRNGIKHVDCFKTGQALFASMSEHSYDIYIIDLELPDIDFVSLVDEIRQRDAGTKIIINTMHEELWTVRKMTSKMVDGVIYKSGELDDLLDAILCVAKGGHYYCDRFEQMLTHIKTSSGILSKREQQILIGIARGLSTKDIAQELYISKNTVESHRQNIFSKMGARNMADLVVKAIASGYIDPKDFED